MCEDVMRTGKNGFESENETETYENTASVENKQIRSLTLQKGVNIHTGAVNYEITELHLASTADTDQIAKVLQDWRINFAVDFANGHDIISLSTDAVHKALDALLDDEVITRDEYDCLTPKDSAILKVVHLGKIKGAEQAAATEL